jgi:ATP-binding cassette subfamily B protein
VLWAAEPAYRAVFAATAQVGEEKPQVDEEELCA